MARTTITIRLEPEEYDMLKDLVRTQRDEQNELAKDQVVNAEDRHEAKGQSIRLDNLLKQL